MAVIELVLGRLGAEELLAQGLIHGVSSVARVARINDVSSGCNQSYASTQSSRL